ncbi:CRISPR-associated endonuclease Cas1 [Methanospirillum sp.]
MNVNWKVVGGYGAHIKSNRTEIIISHRGNVTEIPIRNISHFLLIGGHTIQTSTISTLMKEGTFISFCESDGKPVGYIAPYDYTSFKEIQNLQETTAPYSYALTCAFGSMKSRIFAIEEYTEKFGTDILYSGELDILSGYLNELGNMVLIDELRRIDQLVRDMYYEIISRIISPTYNFKRRTIRPYRDPVNAILSFGYGMLSSACMRAVIGGHLNPSSGFLNRGDRALIQDLMNCWKPGMIDKPAIEFLASDDFPSKGFELTRDRCILHEEIITKLITLFSESIEQNLIDSQIQNLLQALQGETQFTILRSPTLKIHF